MSFLGDGLPAPFLEVAAGLSPLSASGRGSKSRSRRRIALQPQGEGERGEQLYGTTTVPFSFQWLAANS